MRILYVTTVGITMGFFKSLIKDLIDEGHTIDIATNELDGEFPVPACYGDWGCKVYPMPWTRSPKDKGNIKAIKKLRQLVDDNGYDIVHCHTPIASVCTRIACKPLRKNGLKAIYTAHGFHFFDGAPLKNWLVFYPIEKHFSRYTDVLITINKEDYKRAKEKFKAKKTVYIPGVGIDTAKFAPSKSAREKIRAELGIGKDDFCLMSVGELNDNKNHQTIIRAISILNNPHIHYILCGIGSQELKLRRLAENFGLVEKVHFLGFREDITDILQAADAFCFPSKREGLGLAALEAMCVGLPLLTSNIHGIKDYSVNGVTGYCYAPTDVNGFAEGIAKLMGDCETRYKMGRENAFRAQKYNKDNIISKMKIVYSEEVLSEC